MKHISLHLPLYSHCGSCSARRGGPTKVSDMTVLDVQRCSQAGWIHVTPPALASLCNLIGTVTVRRLRAYCDGTAAAATWGKAYIQGSDYPLRSVTFGGRPMQKSHRTELALGPLLASYFGVGSSR